MGDYKDLLKLTNILVTYMDFSARKYAEVKETGLDGDFYHEVKPFADKVKGVKDQWAILAKQFVQEERPKNLYQQQIDAAEEHMEALSVQAFFPQTSRSRFNHMMASTVFILNNIIELAEKKKPSPVKEEDLPSDI